MAYLLENYDSKKNIRSENTCCVYDENKLKLTTEVINYDLDSIVI